MKNVLKPLVKSVLTSTSAAHVEIQKRCFWVGTSFDLAQQNTALVTSNEEMEVIEITY